MNYLSRGKGKKNSAYRKTDFYSYYTKNHKSSRVDLKTWTNFTTDVFTILGEAMVKENLEVRFQTLGRFRVQAIRSTILKNDGTLRERKPDWQACWEYWESKWPNLTRDEITQIKNKTIIYHENEHTNSEYYKFIWDNISLSFLKFYEFKPTRHLQRLLAKTVKDPSRKVFYYG